MGSFDAVGYALAVDSLGHEGVADPSRIPASACAQPFQPGVDPTTFASACGNYLNAIGQAQRSAPQASSEPPLKCYVFASCRIVTPPKPSGRHHPKHTGRHRRHNR